MSRALLAASLLALAACNGEEHFSYQELQDACVRRNACEVMPYPRVKDCVSAYYTLKKPQGLSATYAAIYRCVNKAGGDCAKVRDCFGLEAAASCGSDYLASCSGKRTLSCDLLSHAVYSLDCGESGLRCAVPQDLQFEARCTTGSCNASDPRRCEGDRLLSCANGLWEIVDCDERGLSCASSSSGSSECVGRGEVCQAADRCEDSTAIRCVGGREARQQCVDQPLTTACQNGRCVAAGSECLDELDRCAGDKLETCLDGRWVQLDCSQLGLSPCVPSTLGAHCGG